jgi:hypothetical protein
VSKVARSAVCCSVECSNVGKGQFRFQESFYDFLYLFAYKYQPFPECHFWPPNLHFFTQICHFFCHTCIRKILNSLRSVGNCFPPPLCSKNKVKIKSTFATHVTLNTRNYVLIFEMLLYRATRQYLPEAESIFEYLKYQLDQK